MDFEQAFHLCGVKVISVFLLHLTSVDHAASLICHEVVCMNSSSLEQCSSQEYQVQCEDSGWCETTLFVEESCLPPDRENCTGERFYLSKGCSRLKQDGDGCNAHGSVCLELGEVNGQGDEVKQICSECCRADLCNGGDVRMRAHNASSHTQEVVMTARTLVSPSIGSKVEVPTSLKQDTSFRSGCFQRRTWPIAANMLVVVGIFIVN